MKLTRWFTLYMLFAIFSLSVLPGVLAYAVQGEMTVPVSIFVAIWAVCFMLVGIVVEGNVYRVLKYWQGQNTYLVREIGVKDDALQMAQAHIDRLTSGSGQEAHVIRVQDADLKLVDTQLKQAKAERTRLISELTKMSDKVTDAQNLAIKYEMENYALREKVLSVSKEHDHVVDLYEDLGEKFDRFYDRIKVHEDAAEQFAKTIGII